MKRIFYTRQFKRLYKKLPQSIKKKFKRQLELLTKDIRHPSLKARKMVGTENVWEARIDYHYRMTFQFENDDIVLRAIGTHEIYRKAQKL